MRTLLLSLLCALPLLAEAGIQDVPPWPNQEGSELVTDGDLEVLTNWTVGGCAAASVGNGVGGTDAVEITSDCTALQQGSIQLTLDADTAPWLIISAKIKKTASADGTVSLSVRDQAHGTYFAPLVKAFRPQLAQSSDLADGLVIGGGDFIEIAITLAVTPRHDNENWRLDVISTGVTTGTWYIDDITIKQAWYPLYSFVKYPVNKGYLWSGFDSRHCAGTDIDEACGFVDVRPPTGTTIAQTYVEIHTDTTAGCASPEATVTIQPTVQRTSWDADMSFLADDGTGYICADLRLDSDDSLVSDFPDWKIIQRTTAWRTTNLKHWVDDFGRWVDGTVPRFLWMTYQRFVADNCSTCVYTSKQSYLDIQGFGGRSIWEDFTRSGRNVSLYFSPMSGVNPNVGSDQVTPWLDALSDLGLRFWQIATPWRGELLGDDEEEDGDEAPSAPTISCSSSGGSISDAWVYTKVAAVGGNHNLISPSKLLESEASVSDHNVSALSGSTNSCTITMPSVAGNAVGFWVYAEGRASEAEPANGDYSLVGTRFYEAGKVYDLTEILDTQKEPLTASLGSVLGQQANPITGRPSWQVAGDTWDSVTDEYETAASSYDELLGYYLCDETTAYDAGRTYQVMDHLRTNYPGRLNMCLPLEVRALPGIDWFYSPLVDINAQDIYYEGQSLPEDLEFGYDTSGRSATCYDFSPSNNATASYNNVNLNKVDEWIYQKMKSHEGSRMNLAVLQQWGRSSTTCYGWTLDEMRKQLWKSIIGMQNWGSIGGVGTWGWVSVQGLDRMARIPPDQDISGGDPIANTNALRDDIAAGAEMMAIEYVIIEPVDDSTEMGWGTVLDTAPTSTVTLPTASCVIDGVTVPIRAVAKVMDNGDQYIFATNLCPDSQTMTFSLVAQPAGAIAQDVLTGEIYTITTGDFSVSSTDFDVHVIKISTPTGGGVRGRS